MKLEDVEPEESALVILERICATAAGICGGQAAILTYHREGRTRLLASYGIDYRFRVFEFDLEKAPYERDQFVVKYAAGTERFYRNFAASLGISNCTLFVRAPVSVTGRHTTSLIILGTSGVKRLSEARLRAVREAAQLSREKLDPHFAALDDDSEHVSAVATLAEVAASVEISPNLVGLVDDRLKILAISASLAETVGRKVADLVGQRVGDIGLQSGDAASFLFRKALDTGISPPPYEVIRPHPDGGMQVFVVNATPFSPMDTKQYFVYFSARDVTAISRRAETLSRRFKPTHQEVHGFEEPSMRFLLDTLVRRRALRERNGISYLTFESWRLPIRTYQIAALKALKQNVPLELSHAVASRMAGEINHFVGLSAFKFIVPVPCGNSAGDSCLSLEIARSLGSLTGLPVLSCLSLPRGGGSSHPKNNVRRARMSLTETISGPALLVDDVATSGSHIEEATRLLRPTCGAVLAVAWIGT
ncbi:MAG: hypothetical protein IOC82_03960 [Aestuariivirga sp.]|uniref:hypothetical protein n=1 Tax=Aestuariivirga sp. TaxID=2650926 RepID=UPI0025C222CB|nr:hypothetical protein [Aestuariivirga sp.]MCA3560168.1 hypothetical protein [Aestuariivirga sp.]